MPTDNAASDVADLIASALAAHGWEDWYIALLSRALDKVGDVHQAIALANRVYIAHPEDEADPKEDDAAIVLGLKEG